MILHFLTDDKFADYVINQFEGDIERNKMLLVCDTIQINNVNQVNKIHVVSSKSSDFFEIVSNLSIYNAIVFHGLFWPWQEKILRCVPSTVKVAWMFWGGDVYSRKQLIRSFLLPRTRFYFGLYNFKNHFLKGKQNTYQVPKDVFYRIDYCLTGVIEEVQFARKYFDKEFAYLWYTYYSIEETLGSLVGRTCTGNNIFLGNSCTIENNHLDAFHLLKRLSIKDRSVIVPLSYGSPWLKNLLMKKGRRFFGKQFQPLLTFLPREVYNRVMLDCSVMVMPHLRPQAQGNIITGLYLGMRVYLSEKSMAFAFLKRIGAVVCSIERELIPSNPKAFDPLPESERAINRKVLSDLYCKANVMHAVKEVSRILNA